jgi:hypothetical protein
MKDARGTHQSDLAGARRAHRGANAVIAQYLHELSDRHRSSVRKLEAVAASEAGAEEAALAAESR